MQTHQQQRGTTAPSSLLNSEQLERVAVRVGAVSSKASRGARDVLKRAGRVGGRPHAARPRGSRISPSNGRLPRSARDHAGAPSSRI